MMEKILDLSPTCASTNIRQTQIMVTQFYDKILAPSGLRAVQLGLLSAIATLAPVTLNRLAQFMDMDRAALSRQMKTFVERGLIRVEDGADRGANQMFLTPEGQRMLEGAWPFWQEAQERLETAFGPERFTALLAELRAMRTMFNIGAA